MKATELPIDGRHPAISCSATERPSGYLGMAPRLEIRINLQKAQLDSNWIIMIVKPAKLVKSTNFEVRHSLVKERVGWRSGRK